MADSFPEANPSRQLPLSCRPEASLRVMQRHFTVLLLSHLDTLAFSLTAGLGIFHDLYDRESFPKDKKKEKEKTPF